jgi:anti-sigma regulatory factor (Ser/Thr protein kinase)
MNPRPVAHNDKFRHEALFYSDWTEFVAGTVPFIRNGLAEGEPVLVVESPEKIQLLRTALGEDADRVLFADMAQVGANPARIIPAWRDFVQEQGAGGKRLRGIGEPIWDGRTRDELVECQRHESLLNVAFGHSQPWWLLCPYDTRQLDDAVLEEARRSHEYLMDARSVSAVSEEFRGIDASGEPFVIPLSEPSTGVRKLAFDAETLLKQRGTVARFATSAGCSATRAIELVTAVNEVATNSVVHGGGGGTLRMWREKDDLIAEVRDQAGVYNLPLGDRQRPTDKPGDPRGLWLANQLCDLVQIRSMPNGTAVRLHLKVDPRRRLRLVPRQIN